MHDREIANGLIDENCSPRNEGCWECVKQYRILNKNLFDRTSFVYFLHIYFQIGPLEKVDDPFRARSNDRALNESYLPGSYEGPVDYLFNWVQMESETSCVFVHG